MNDLVCINLNPQNNEYEQENFETEIRPPKIRAINLIRKKDFRTIFNSTTESLLLEIQTYGKNGNTVTIEYEGQHLIDKKAWITRTSEFFANFDIDCPEKDFKALKQGWYETAELKEIYLCPGTQNNKHIWSNAFYDFNTKKLESICHSTYATPQKSLVDMSNSCLPVLSDFGEDKVKVFQDFFTNFCETFTDFSVLACFGNALGVVYWDLFQKGTEGFAPVLFSGESHSGKSTLLKVIAAIFGLNSSSFVSGDSTIFSIIHEHANRLNIPVFIEELTTENLAKFEQVTKNVYTGVSRARGNKKGIEKTPIFTSFIGTSNFFFSKLSPQLLTRLFFANMKNENTDFSHFKYFDSQKLQKLSVILPIFLSHKDIILDFYNKIYLILSQNIPKKTRLISNLAISCTIWQLVNTIAKKQLVDWMKMALEYDNYVQNFMNSDVKTGDIIINDITRLIESDKLECGIDWKLVKNAVLRLNINRYLEKFNIVNPNNMMKPAQFRLAVSSDKRFNLKTIPMKDLNRAISIDISECEYLLQKLNSIQTILSITGKTNNEEEESC